MFDQCIVWQWWRREGNTNQLFSLHQNEQKHWTIPLWVHDYGRTDTFDSNTIEFYFSSAKIVKGLNGNSLNLSYDSNRAFQLSIQELKSKSDNWNNWTFRANNTFHKSYNMKYMQTLVCWLSQTANSSNDRMWHSKEMHSILIHWIVFNSYSPCLLH